jgi:phosphohistidine phosphatase SixA
MSDLQCAATLLLARPGDTSTDGSLSPRGREQAHDLGRSLLDRRLAVVYTSTLAASVQTAGIVERETGVSVVVHAGLDDYGSVAELEALADQHRGETVLVLSGAGGARAGCAIVEVSIDADGWAAQQ